MQGRGLIGRVCFPHRSSRVATRTLYVAVLVWSALFCWPAPGGAEPPSTIGVELNRLEDQGGNCRPISYHQRIVKKTNDILARQPDAAEPVGVVKVERRQRIPTGIGGSDRLENAVRLRRQQSMDKLPAGGMAPQIGL